jgi:aminoglycoside phosphotransferase (APT) family kinase protein
MNSRRTKQQNIREEAKAILLNTYPNATNVQLLKSGNYSGVYYFEINSKRLVFKMPSIWFPLESESYFYSRARNTGLVPAIHKSNDNEGWFVMDFIKGDGDWIALGQYKNLKLWRSLGRATFKVHLIKTDGVGLYINGKFRNSTHQDFFKLEFDWLRKNDVFRKTINLDESKERMLLNASSLLEHKKSLLHGDLSLNNTIRDKDKVKAFIDPGPWRGGHPFLDLGHIHSQALNYPDFTVSILKAFGEGYCTKINWDAIELQFCSLYWDLTVLRFLAENDTKEFRKRCTEQKNTITRRFANIQRALTILH